MLFRSIFVVHARPTEAPAGGTGLLQLGRAALMRRWAPRRQLHGCLGCGHQSVASPDALPFVEGVAVASFVVMLLSFHGLLGQQYICLQHQLGVLWLS